MKKLFTLFAVAAVALGAHAQNTLTICEGLSYSNASPICGLYADTEGTMTQTIYPADILAEMSGKQITDLTFYTLADYYFSQGQESTDATDYINFENATLQLSLLEVEQEGYDDVAPVAVDGVTPVATVTPTKGDYMMTFSLDQPFEYKGGNLLVEVKVITPGTWGQTYFFGDGTEEYYPGYYFVDGDEGANGFLPKATFTYEDVLTGITSINEAAVTSVKYVNLNGQTSDKPFKGVNVKVMTRTDGTTTSTKVVF